MVDLIKELQEKNIRVSLKENNLEINFDGEIDDVILKKLKENKTRLMDFLTQHSNVNKGIKNVQLSESYPISNAQKRLWIQSQNEENSKTYNISNLVELNGDYDVSIFEAAIFEMINRHEILRTIFKLNEDGEVRQLILSHTQLDFKVAHLDFRNDKEPYNKAIAYIHKDNDTVFDLENGPLLRVAFIKTADNLCIFYFNLHHIITDGWSLKILQRDLFAYYEAIKYGNKCNLENLRIQYKDYASWQFYAIKNGDYKKHEEFWAQLLSGDLPKLDLPGIKTRPKTTTYNGHALTTYLNPVLTGRIKDFCIQNGGSLFMGLLSVLKVLLNKYTAQDDIIVGTVVAGREDSDLEDQIGFYVNSLALRNKIDVNDSFLRFFNNVKKATLEIFSHQIYPFDVLVEEINPARDFNRNPFFDIMYVLHNIVDTDNQPIIDKDKYDTVIDSGNMKSNFDLNFEFEEIGNSISFVTIFNEDLYDKVKIEKFMTHFKQLLAVLLENPNAIVKSIEYLTTAEKEELLAAEYWKGVFAAGIPKVKFPFEKQRPENYTYTTNKIQFEVDNELTKQLKIISGNPEDSLHTTVLFLVKLLIYKYTDQDKIMIGSPFYSIEKAGDNNSSAAHNFLPIVSNIKEDDSLQYLYGSIKNSISSIQDDFWISSEVLREQIAYKEEQSYSGLFNVFVDFQDKTNPLSGAGTLAKEFQNNTSPDNELLSQFDLSLEFQEKADGLDCILTYNNSLFDKIHIELFANRFLNLVRQVTHQENDFGTTQISSLNLDFNLQLPAGKDKQNTILEENF